jgi:hypothetical protein
MSADKHRGIRRQKQKRAKDSKKARRQHPPAAAIPNPAANAAPTR